MPVTEAREGQYAFSAEITIRRSPAELTRWLIAPELLSEWILGAVRVEEMAESEQPGGRVRLVAGSVGKGYTGTYVGVLDGGPDRIVRRYRLEQEAYAGQYSRTVTYDLRSRSDTTRVVCSVDTCIAGLPAAAARVGARAEERSLTRSLHRLKAVVDTGRIGFLERARTSAYNAQPL